MQLTKEDLAALRKSTDVTFHLVDGKATIDALIRARSSSFAERRREIEVAFSSTIYTNPRAGRCLERAFAMVMCSKYDHAWQTTLGLLRVGDELILHWIVDGHTTEGLEPHGFHGDSLELIAVRKEKRLVFHVCTETSLDNSARMCKLSKMKI
jgi:hypothetical protein